MIPQLGLKMVPSPSCMFFILRASQLPHHLVFVRNSELRPHSGHNEHPMFLERLVIDYEWDQPCNLPFNNSPGGLHAHGYLRSTVIITYFYASVLVDVDKACVD